MAPPGRRDGARAAGADDERAQRRRPRRQQGRLPGVHGGARGRGELLRGAAHRRRGVPRAQAHAARARPGHRRGRRGRLRPRPRVERGGARRADRGDRGGRLRAGRGRGDRARPRHQRDLPRRRLRARARGPQPVRRRDVGLLGRDGRPLPDPVDRGRHGRGGLGRLEAAHRGDRRARAAGGRRPVRDQHRAPAARHRVGHRQLDPGQGQPDRDAHRDARRRAYRAARRATPP